MRQLAFLRIIMALHLTTGLCWSCSFPLPFLKTRSKRTYEQEIEGLRMRLQKVEAEFSETSIQFSKTRIELDGARAVSCSFDLIISSSKRSPFSAYYVKFCRGPKYRNNNAVCFGWTLKTLVLRVINRVTTATTRGGSTLKHTCRGGGGLSLVWPLFPIESSFHCKYVSNFGQCRKPFFSTRDIHK